MRVIFIVAILVILLIAVSWFKPIFCQELGQEALLQEYLKQNKGVEKTDQRYYSPDIYGSNQTTPIPGANIANPGAIPPGDSTVKNMIIEKQADGLEPFGYSLFTASAELSSAPEVADAADYVLGPSDNIIINLWGKVEKEYNLTVDRQGKIFIPKVGEIVVWGLSLSQFESIINKKLSGVYSDFKSSISLGKIRSIRIYMTGEVKKPGAYTTSSLTTLFNALYLAGGPNKSGSMRNIQLIRNNSLVATLDLYQFLLKGDSKNDVRLSSGDAIFIPMTGPRVAVEGKVRRPAIYELLGGEKVSQLLTLAGGPAAEAYLDRIMLDRISPRDEREILDLNMNPNNGGKLDDIEIVDGDRLKIFSLYDLKRNIVIVAGMVKHPGSFERTDSTTVRDLIAQGELLPQNVYYERANLFRHYPDRRMDVFPINLKDALEGRFNMKLQDLDSLHVYRIDQVLRKKYVSIDGEVNAPGEYPLYDNMNLSDLIFLAGNLKKNAYQLGCELARTDSLGKVHLEYPNMSEVNIKQYKLQEDDRIFIRQIPDWFLHRMVTIEGEVKFPGRYALYSREETLYDLIKRAGGFTERAFPKGATFQRHSIQQDLLRQNLPEIISNTQPLEEDSSGHIKQVELMKVNLGNMSRVVIDINKIISTQGEKGNITLENADYVYIPSIPGGISVMGSVGANGTIKFDENKNVRYYIERAGNFTRQAEKKGTRLIKADGRVFSGGGTLRDRVEIGDAIIVPIEIKKEHDGMKTLSTTASIVAGLLTSVFIITKL
ncbi:MAG: SLBB domain-containing protein [candidate division Zixibacteria bacterium]|nr:SLBB domain-containing protein [candidate division Zixibacteria bacterium]